MDDFQDEDSVREKLGIPLRTPQKKRKGRPTYESSEKQDSPLDTVPVKDKPRSRPNKNKPKKKKKVHFSSSEQAKKKEFDNIVESIVLANTMIDAADPRDKDGLDFIVEIVGIIKSSETTLIEAISSVQNAELLDYAIKVNDDWQTTIQRFKTLKRGRKPDPFVPTHNQESEVEEEPEENLEEVKINIRENSRTNG